MEIILCNYFIISKIIISKLWNTIEDKRCDLTPLFHCVTFSEKQEVDDVIQHGLFPRK